MFAASSQSGAPVQEDAAMTMSPDQVLEPKAPSLRSHPLVSTTVPSVKKWYESFDTETQQNGKKDYRVAPRAALRQRTPSDCRRAVWDPCG